jgi:hypothetical protein
MFVPQTPEVTGRTGPSKFYLVNNIVFDLSREIFVLKLLLRAPFNILVVVFYFERPTVPS